MNPYKAISWFLKNCFQIQLVLLHHGPTVNLINPLSGPTPGGTELTVYGANLGFEPELVNVTIGGARSNVTFSEGHKSFKVFSPPGVGAQSEIVVSVAGQAAPLASMLRTFAYALPAAATYSPRVLPTEGGVEVIINGTNFGGAAVQVEFGLSI